MAAHLCAFLNYRNIDIKSYKVRKEREISLAKKSSNLCNNGTIPAQLRTFQTTLISFDSLFTLIPVEQSCHYFTPRCVSVEPHLNFLLCVNAFILWFSGT